MVMERVARVIKPASARRGAEAMDSAMLVSTTSKQEIDPRDRSKISDSLILEAGTDPTLAEQIALAVEDRIDTSNLMTGTTAIIREMVDLELLDRGLAMMHKKHTHIGLPMWDVEQIITNANKENSNTTHNPESVNLTIAGTIPKEFALRRVFTDDVAETHYVGDPYADETLLRAAQACSRHLPCVVRGLASQETGAGE